MNFSREQLAEILARHKIYQKPNLALPKSIFQARKNLSLKKKDLNLFLQYASKLKRNTTQKILKHHYHSKLDVQFSSLPTTKLLSFRNKVSRISCDTTYNPGFSLNAHNKAISDKKHAFKILKSLIYNSKRLSGVTLLKEIPYPEYLELLTKAKNLKSLEITLGFHHVLVYPDILKNLKRLENLKLTLLGNCFYSKKEEIRAAFGVFFKYLAQLPHLQHINLSLQDSSHYDNFNGVSQLLLALNQLNLSTFRLHIDLTTPQQIDFSALNSLLAKTDCLQIFDLPEKRQELTPIEVKSPRKIIFNIFPHAKADIASLITHSTSLTSLYLSSYDSLKPFQQNFKLAPSLQKLVFKSAVALSNDGEMESFLQCLYSAMTDVVALEELQIKSNYIGAVSTYRLGLLAQLPAIQNHMKTFGLDIEVQKVFKRSEKPKKEKKVIYGNMFKDLAHVLGQMKNLTNLKLDFNHFTLKPVQDLEMALGVCKKLKSLVLNIKLEGDFKETEFKFPFEKMKDLRELTLHFDQTWSKKSKEHFVEKVSILEKLTKIGLSECFPDRAKLVTNLQKIPTLQKIHIKDKNDIVNSL